MLCSEGTCHRPARRGCEEIGTPESCSTCPALAVYFVGDRGAIFYACAEHVRLPPPAKDRWIPVRALSGLEHRIARIVAEMVRDRASEV